MTAKEYQDKIASLTTHVRHQRQVILELRKELEGLRKIRKAADLYLASLNLKSPEDREHTERILKVLDYLIRSTEINSKQALKRTAAR